MIPNLDEHDMRAFHRGGGPARDPDPFWAIIGKWVGVMLAAAVVIMVLAMLFGWAESAAPATCPECGAVVGHEREGQP